MKKIKKPSASLLIITGFCFKEKLKPAEHNMAVFSGKYVGFNAV